MPVSSRLPFLALALLLAACGGTRAPLTAPAPSLPPAQPGGPPEPVVLGRGSALPAPDGVALEGQARALIAPFGAEMLAAVQQAMAAGGAVSAIDACQVLAPVIAGRHSRQPWTVGRTALRLRNPANAPDAWERQVLERFAVEAAQGRPLAELRHGEVVGGEYRYLQAIATAAPCLACHGAALAPEVAAALQVRYPQDEATGFAAGELRGAFTLRRRLD